MRKIVVIGSSNTDMVIVSDELPSVGAIVGGGTYSLNPGGKGAIQSIAASRLGGSVCFITKTGNDMFGRQAKQLYATEGISTDYIFADPSTPSGLALMMVNKDGDKYVSIAQGAITNLSMADIDKARSQICEAGILMIELETPIETAIYAARIAKGNGVTVMLNPSPCQPIPDTLLELTDIIAPNRTEARYITGITVNDLDSAREAIRRICDLGVRNVILTLGPMGALVYTDGEYTYLDALDVELVDSTGAGDVFCASVCVGLCEGLDLISASKIGVIASGISITRKGTIPSLPFRYELGKYTKNFI